jgi:hypothetical protein
MGLGRPYLEAEYRRGGVAAFLKNLFDPITGPS